MCFADVANDAYGTDLSAVAIVFTSTLLTSSSLGVTATNGRLSRDGADLGLLANGDIVRNRSR